MNKRYNWAVGRKAETLVHDMMEELGFEVVKFGYEYLLPSFANKKKLLKGRAGDIIRAQPDFLIVDPKYNHAYFIEVKYREYGKIRNQSIHYYPENFIVLVSKKGLLIADWEDAVKEKDKKPNFKRLIDIGPFRYKDKTIIMKYVEKAKKEFY